VKWSEVESYYGINWYVVRSLHRQVKWCEVEWSRELLRNKLVRSEKLTQTSETMWSEVEWSRELLRNKLVRSKKLTQTSERMWSEMRWSRELLRNKLVRSEKLTQTSETMWSEVESYNEINWYVVRSLHRQVKWCEVEWSRELLRNKLVRSEKLTQTSEMMWSGVK
jgi:hypothetical protein